MVNGVSGEESVLKGLFYRVEGFSCRNFLVVSQLFSYVPEQ